MLEYSGLPNKRIQKFNEKKNLSSFLLITLNILDSNK